MNNELTKEDIAIMQEELDHRRLKLMPELIEEVKRTRAFGDLSENYEYKAAKQAQNANKKRIRYLDRMIRSATVIDGHAPEGQVGLFDKVTLYFEEDEEEQVVQVVSTVRCDPRQGRISKESPLGKALLGRRTGERLQVEVSPAYRYFVVIRAVEKEADDGSAPIL